MRRGALSIETIIVMIIAVSILVLVLIFITSKWTGLSGSFNEIEEPVTALIDQSLL